MGSVGRNAPCPCGSGLKFKRCHGRLDGLPAPMPVKDIFRLRDAEERIRTVQQGAGRPIVSFEANGYRLVGVKNTLHWSNKWKTFPDFLDTYVKQKLGSEWGEAERAKPLAERHPFMQIFDSYAGQMDEARKRRQGDVFEVPWTGAVVCFWGVAYALYLLEHNVELQARLLKRLRNKGNFAGAYYELWVAGALIRAGFDLELNDEKGGGPRQCEWDAISKATGKRYTVEVKMRGAEGQLGRTAADGGPDAEPRFTNLLLDALKKPAKGERMVFIDVNVPHVLTEAGSPSWGAEVFDRLESFERDKLAAGTSAYVFMTNFAFHRQLDVSPGFAVATFGLGIADFSRREMITLGDAYRRKLKHGDAENVVEHLKTVTQIPSTFDGGLPSQSMGGGAPPIRVGETYLFEKAGGNGEDVLGKVNDVVVAENEKRAYVAVTDMQTGGNMILAQPMTDADLSDYRQFGDSVFGKEFQKHKSENEFEFFEWLMKANANTSREKLIEWLGPAHRPNAEGLSDEDLRIYYCEAMVATAVQRKGPEAA